MTTLAFDDQRFNREVSFCKVYSLEDVEKATELVQGIESVKLKRTKEE